MIRRVVPVVDLDVTGDAEQRDVGEPVPAPPKFRDDPQWKRIRNSMGPHAADVDLDQHADTIMRRLISRRLGNAHHDLDQISRDTDWLADYAETEWDRDRLSRLGQIITEALLVLEELGG